MIPSESTLNERKTQTCCINFESACHSSNWGTTLLRYTTEGNALIKLHAVRGFAPMLGFFAALIHSGQK